jgi:hypothetical protein
MKTHNSVLRGCKIIIGFGEREIAIYLVSTLGTYLLAGPGGGEGGTLEARTVFLKRNPTTPRPWLGLGTYPQQWYSLTLEEVRGAIVKPGNTIPNGAIKLPERH